MIRGHRMISAHGWYKRVRIFRSGENRKKKEKEEDMVRDHFYGILS